MRLMLVNTKQRIAVLASGLVVATSGYVTDEASAAPPVAPTSAPAQVTADENDSDAPSYPKAGPRGGAKWERSS
jgi:hypothetical protein